MTYFQFSGVAGGQNKTLFLHKTWIVLHIIMLILNLKGIIGMWWFVVAVDYESVHGYVLIVSWNVARGWLAQNWSGSVSCCTRCTQCWVDLSPCPASQTSPVLSSCQKMLKGKIKIYYRHHLRPILKSSKMPLTRNQTTWNAAPVTRGAKISSVENAPKWDWSPRMMMLPM